MALLLASGLAGSGTLLFMDGQDIEQGTSYGLIEPRAATLAPDPSFSAPPGLRYFAGAVIFGAFEGPGGYEVYGANTTGWEPMAVAGAKRPKLTTTVLRFTSHDNLQSYSEPEAVLSF